MIDIEYEIDTLIFDELSEKYPSAAVSGEYDKAPAQFPFVSVEEIENVVNATTRDSGNIERHSNVTYEINVYSNRVSGKKDECKKIFAIIDELMAKIGFTRIMLNPTPNINDATVYRMTGRYRAVVGKDNVIYRR